MAQGKTIRSCPRTAKIARILAALSVALLFQAGYFGWAFAKVSRIQIEHRQMILHGKSFGNRGPYEMLAGRVEYAFDPANPMNRRIVDLQLAPRGQQLVPKHAEELPR